MGFGPWKMEVYACFYGISWDWNKKHELRIPRKIQEKWAQQQMVLMGFDGIEPRKPLGLNHSVVRGISWGYMMGTWHWWHVHAFSGLGHITIDLTRRIWDSLEPLEALHSLIRKIVGVTWGEHILNTSMCSRLTWQWKQHLSMISSRLPRILRLGH